MGGVGDEEVPRVRVGVVQAVAEDHLHVDVGRALHQRVDVPTGRFDAGAVGERGARDHRHRQHLGARPVGIRRRDDDVGLVGEVRAEPLEVRAAPRGGRSRRSSSWRTRRRGSSGAAAQAPDLWPRGTRRCRPSARGPRARARPRRRARPSPRPRCRRRASPCALGRRTRRERFLLERREELGDILPSSVSTVCCATPGGSAGTAPWSCSSSAATSAPTTSGRRLSICPNLTHVVPSSVSAFRSRSPSDMLATSGPTTWSRSRCSTAESSRPDPRGTHAANPLRARIVRSPRVACGERSACRSASPWRAPLFTAPRQGRYRQQ